MAVCSRKVLHRSPHLIPYMLTQHGISQQNPHNDNQINASQTGIFLQSQSVKDWAGFVKCYHGLTELIGVILVHPDKYSVLKKAPPFPWCWLSSCHEWRLQSQHQVAPWPLIPVTMCLTKRHPFCSSITYNIVLLFSVIGGVKWPQGGAVVRARVQRIYIGNDRQSVHGSGKWYKKMKPQKWQGIVTNITNYNRVLSWNSSNANELAIQKAE